MNLLDSKCTKCSVRLLVSQIEWHDPHAHVCGGCYTDYLLMVQKQNSSLPDDDEFEIALDELDLYNDFDYLDTPEFNVASCECGASKAGSVWHSRWCPVFKEPMERDKDSILIGSSDAN